MLTGTFAVAGWYGANPPALIDKPSAKPDDEPNTPFGGYIQIFPDGNVTGLFVDTGIRWDVTGDISTGGLTIRLFASDGWLVDHPPKNFQLTPGRTPLDWSGQYYMGEAPRSPTVSGRLVPNPRSKDGQDVLQLLAVSAEAMATAGIRRPKTPSM